MKNSTSPAAKTKNAPAPISRVCSSLLLLLILTGMVGCATRGNDASQGASGIENRELIKNTRSWDGELLPPYPDGQPEVSIRRFVIPPGAQLPMHKHPVINAGVLLSGELEVVKEDGRTLRLKAGDPIIEMVNTWHYGRNPGKVPAEIIVVYAGTPGVPVAELKP
jgi:quercetin dioxygenase-like cupin family protein